MSKIPPLKAKKVIKKLLKLGFYIHHQTGSHAQIKHYNKVHLRVTVPRHDRSDLPYFVIKNILNQAEISSEDFLKLL